MQQVRQIRYKLVAFYALTCLAEDLGMIDSDPALSQGVGGLGMVGAETD